MTLGFFLILSMASILGVHRYAFGVADHWSTLPITNYYLDHTLYANDYFQEVRPYYYTLLWIALATASKLLHVGLPPLFFLCHVVIIYMSFLGLYMVSMALFHKRSAALLAAFLLLVVVRTPLACDCLLEGVLTTRTAAMPVLLFAFYFFLTERYPVSYLLQGLAFLIHPLTAAHFILIMGIPLVFAAKRIGPRRLVLSTVIMFVVAAPVLIWRVLYSPHSGGGIRVDPQWLDIVRFRDAAMTFPSSFSFDDFLRLVLVTFVLIVSSKYKPRVELHRVVLYAVAAVFALFVVGAVFTELIPVRLLICLHLFRASRFLLFFAMLYFANYCVTELSGSGRVLDKMAAALVALGLLYEASPDGWRVIVMLYLAWATCIALVGSLRDRDPSPAVFAFSLSVLALLLGLGASLQRGGRTQIADVTTPEWLDVQRWARENTDKNDLFIVPPFCEGFRNNSYRAIYGDWKDGTMAYWSPPFAREWMRRMEKLGMDRTEASLEGRVKGYQRLGDSRFLRIASECGTGVGHVYAVTTVDHSRLIFREVYRNSGYRVHQIPH